MAFNFCRLRMRDKFAPKPSEKTPIAEKSPEVLSTSFSSAFAILSAIPDSRAIWWLLGVACGVAFHPMMNSFSMSQGTARNLFRHHVVDRGNTDEVCAIGRLSLGIDSRFNAKADELTRKVVKPGTPSFEELYALVVNEPWNEKDNIWNSFPNAYNMQPRFSFPFSNLRPAHVERVLTMLGRAPKLVLEVGSFHGHSALMTAGVLDKHDYRDTPLLCIDPWTGDLGELLFRDDWQKTLTPGEIRDGRSTSYFQFMVNVKSKIEDGTIGPRHIIPLAVTSEVGARYLTALKAKPDLAYLDSAHELDMTYMELTLYYALLPKGGIIYGDDFTWESVGKDVTRFAKEKRLNLQLDGITWMLQKP